MKAIIRNDDLIPESLWTPFIKNHLQWTCTEDPDGDGYALCGDCPEDAKPEDFTIEKHKKVLEDGTTVVVLVAIHHG